MKIDQRINGTPRKSTSKGFRGKEKKKKKISWKSLFEGVEDKVYLIKGTSLDVSRNKNTGRRGRLVLETL